MKHIIKGILLYSTIIYGILLLLFTESLTLPAIIVGWLIMLILVVLCKKSFTLESLNEYIPKWFK